LKRTKYGAIDIGSNAIRLLLVNVYNNDIESIYKKVSLVRVPLRLGKDVFTKGRISDEKAIDFERTIIAFEQLIKVHKVDQYRACATSAMRDAENGVEIVNGVKNRTGINIEIISGKEEAEIIRSTHIEERLEQGHDFLYLDVGGGSTEISFYKNGELQDSKSFDIGTIRLLENKVKQKLWDDLETWTIETTKNQTGLEIIGSGGNINKIYKMLGKSNWQGISFEELSSILSEMESLTVEERMVRYKLHPDRADVIVHAGTIFKSIMQWAQSNEIQVPKLGLSDGIIKSMHKSLSFRDY
tara:strand:+ start:14578 stop:15474 length:897 start_codon:yes stop_codon:yes gene_type:complete